MRVLTLPDPAAVARAAADLLVQEVAANPQLVLGLPTGRTPLPLYAELERRHHAGKIDLSRVTSFHLDELALPPDHPASFASYRQRHAGARLGLDPARADIPRGDAPDLAAECRRYDQALTAAGGLDLAFLGLGEDGHVAYNLPGPPIEETHVVELPVSLADSLGVAQDARPLRALTLGLGALRSARRLVVVVTGAGKRAAVGALLDGPEDPAWPCSLLRGHSRLAVLLDFDAAAGRPRGAAPFTQGHNRSIRQPGPSCR